MGLLDNFTQDDILSGLLSAGAASGAKGNYLARVAQGLATGERFKQGRAEQARQRSQDEMQAEFRQLTKQKMLMDMAQSEAAAAKKDKLTGMMEQMFGGGSAGSVPADGRGPVMPSTVGGGFSGVGINQIALLKALGGPDLIEAHKYANDPLKLEQGATYKNRNTGEERFMPKLDNGIVPDGNGGFVAGQGYPAASASIKAAETRAVEAARAESDLISVPNSDNTTSMVPRAQALNRLNGGGTGPNGSNGLDMSRVSPEQAARLLELDPQAFAAGVSRFGPSQMSSGQGAGPVFGTSQSPAAASAAKIAADAAATKGAEDEAKGNAFGVFREQLKLAEGLLKRGPTSGVIGSGIDTVLGAFNQSTEGSRLAKKLETTGAWMINNIPKAPGAQSEAELRDYKIAAGQVGDRNVPVADRLAAVDAVNGLINVWESRTGGTKPAADAMTSKPPAQQHKGKYLRDKATGITYMSNGMSWVEAK